MIGACLSLSTYMYPISTYNSIHMYVNLPMYILHNRPHPPTHPPIHSSNNPTGEALDPTMALACRNLPYAKALPQVVRPLIPIQYICIIDDDAAVDFAVGVSSAGPDFITYP